MCLLSSNLAIAVIWDEQTKSYSLKIWNCNRHSAARSHSRRGQGAAVV